MTEMVECVMNGRWPMLLPAHRAARPEWTTGWEAAHLASMYANLEPGDVVIDCGAEEGDMSALYASWVNGYRTEAAFQQKDGAGRLIRERIENVGEPGGVILVEPNDRVWPNIKAIFDANDLPAPLACWPGFASENTSPYGALEPGWPASADGPVIGDHGFKSLVESEMTLPNITLDALADVVGRKVDAITIDVEGAELRVLYGAKRIIAEDRPLLWISVHQAQLEYDYGTSSEDLHWWLGDQGYVGQQLERGHEFIWMAAPAERAGSVVWHHVR